MGCSSSVPAKYELPSDVAALQQQVVALQKQLQAAEQQLQALKARPTNTGGGMCEALFWPDGKLPCRNNARPGGCKRPNCEYAHHATSLTRFLEVLSSARTSLSVCVFTITCDEIADAVIEAHRRGVKVRVITDNDQATSLGSDISKFRQAGIEVRQDSAPTHMHHKFCIMDDRVLITGSFNWTRQAVIGNQENVVIQENAALVGAFRNQFEKLWAQFRT